LHLKLRHLAVFHAVMEEGSISKAADRMRLTQPAVSVALAKLEEMLGYTLFIRSKGYFVPKPEAKQLFEDAELAILAFERFQSRAQLIGEGAEGLVRVGSIGAAALYFMPEVISAFSSMREKVDLQLQVRSSSQISYLVGNGQTDIGIVEAPAAGQSLQASEFAIPCVCILPENDPLASESLLTPEHLRDRKMISIEEDHPLERKVRAAFIEAGVPWQASISCYFFAIMRNLVAKGSGVAIVDALTGCVDLNDGVVWRPFAPDLKHDIAVITRSDTALQGPASDFLDMTVAQLRVVERMDLTVEAR